jgi:hypothetical protein
MARAIWALYSSTPPLDRAIHGFRKPFTTAGDALAELHRLNSSSERLAACSPWVAIADVEDCFSNIALRVLRRVLDLTGARADGVNPFFDALERAGVRSLPRDYAELRYVSNLYLQIVDREVDRPFVRFADDYRIFCSSRVEAERALTQLGSTLRSLGLRLNERKSFVTRSLDDRVSMRSPSFRPLVTAFFHRRDLFVALRDHERSYISSYAPGGPSTSVAHVDLERLDNPFDWWVGAAIDSAQTWLLARLLAPMRARPLSKAIARRLATYCVRSAASPVRGLALVAVVGAGHRDVAEDILQWPVDSRFRILAHASLCLPRPEEARDSWPGVQGDVLTRRLTDLALT